MSNEKNLPYAVVCGGVNIDIGAHSFAPLRAKDSNPGKVELSLGGVGRNIAHNMRLLGVPTYLLTAVGGDSRASQVEESCKELGIDLSHALRVPDGRTSTYVFVGDNDGDMAVAVADMEICEKLTPDYFASQKELLDAGLAVNGKKGGVYDRFRNRLMFPIIDVRGNIIRSSSIRCPPSRRKSSRAYSVTSTRSSPTASKQSSSPA